MRVRFAFLLGLVFTTSLLLSAAVLAAPEQLAVTIAPVPNTYHLRLSWTPDPLICAYEVHRANAAYFAPGAGSLQTTLPAGASTYVDYGAGRSIDTNYFYIVRGLPCAGSPVDSRRVGKLYMPLVTPGSAPPIAYRTHGLDFSPYTAAGEDPNKGDYQITDQELADRLAAIAPYTEWVRSFGCNNDLAETGKYAHTMGLKAALGAWLGPETNDAERQSNRHQVDCLKARIGAGEADLAIVGSEVLLRGNLSESQLIAYINEVKQYVRDQGRAVPVTYGDVYGELLAHPNVVAAVDIVFPNYYPYWEGKPLDYAVAHVAGWHAQLTAAYPGKEIIVSETGWPSCGNLIGEAVPSPENASDYFLNFVSWARAEGVKYFIFEAGDEPWKSAPEGPQGACWGVWTGEWVMKPGMERVFAGETVPDNWSDPPPGAPIIDFFALPDHTDTNLTTFVIAGHTEAANEVRLNGAALPASARDSAGNFAYAPALVPGDNTLVLEILSGGQTLSTTTKHVHVDPAFSTADRRLLYVYSTNSDSGVPSLLGTVVIDLDNNTLLGLIPSKFAVGIAPGGREIYMTDRSVYSTATHTLIRTLPFSLNLDPSSFLVAPDGARLYSRNERVAVDSNTLLANLPVDITTGGKGPAISADGRHIYCCNAIKIVDTDANTFVTAPIVNDIQSDVEVTRSENRILVSEYSYAQGRLEIYDAATYALLGTVSGLGDFTGEIGLAEDGRRVVLGSSGNPAWIGDGRLSVIDVDARTLRSQVALPLADNLTQSPRDEFFVSTGENEMFRRQGVDVFMLDSTDHLVRVKTFFLGVNRWVQTTGSPKYDQIRKILYKP